MEQRSREFEFEPQRLVKSTSAQTVGPSTRDRSGDHNQPAATRESVGLQQNVVIHRVSPVDVEPPRQGLTRSPSLITRHIPPNIGSSGSPQDKPKGWIRRLSMPVFSPFEGSKKPDSPMENDSSQTWGSSLALPETKPRHRKTSLDTLSSKSNQRR